MKKIYLFTFSILLASQLAAQNVRMIKDLNMGTADGLPFGSEQTALFASLDTVLIFLALGGENNARILCRTDAKTPSTIPLIAPFNDDQRMGDWVVSGGLFWFAFDNAGTAELYSTDGSLPGTQKRYSVPNARFSKLRAFKNGVVFHEHVANFDEYLTRLLPVDATAMRIGKFHWFSGILDLATDDQVIYGIGCSNEAVSDRYIFTSSGDVGKIESKVLLNTGSEFNSKTYLTPIGNRLFFFYKKNGEERKLWVSDLTANGTTGLKNMEIEEHSLPYPERVTTVFNGKFVFRGESNEDPGKGMELWASDGTSAGTQLVRDIANGTDSGDPRYFTAYKGKLFFTADNFAGYPETWSTDLTTNGTIRHLPVQEWNSPHGFDLCQYKDSLAFGAHLKGFKSGQLVLSQTTEASKKIIAAPAVANEFTFEPTNLVVAGHLLYFAASTAATGRELWVYHPNEKPTVGTKTFDNQQVLKISPNPGSQFLQLELPDATRGTLQVFAADGRQILQKEIVGNEKLDTADWQAGNYFLAFSDGLTFWTGVFQKI